MLCSEQENSDKAIKYGELIVLGCNGWSPAGDRSRRRTRFSLYKRPKANGVQPAAVHIACSPHAAKVLSKNSQHSVSYTLSWAETVVVEYTEDNDTDMFQVGRSTESPIDMVVSGRSDQGDGRLCPSTISRFACRIVCERSPPYTCRLYAAGFDCSRNIFLGEKAAKWRSADGQMDGLTTNGVLLLRPAHGLQPHCRAGVWREVSVCGSVYTLRSAGTAQTRGKLVKDESPVLVDGSLIDLCGVTLLWRSVDGLSRAPTLAHLEALRHRLNAARPHCPVMLDTLAFPSIPGSGSGSGSGSNSNSGSDAPPRPRQPWAYLACGHVHGYHRWRGRERPFRECSAEEEEEEMEEEEEEEADRSESAKGERECPLCRSRGPYVPLTLGRETQAYVDAGTPTHAFVPCGHVCSEATAVYWSKIPMRRGAHVHRPACPFCTKQLFRVKPYVRLIFQGSLD